MSRSLVPWYARGHKQLFLPDINLAFLRGSPKNPYDAKFVVPLWFSKFDLRDYLYNAYNVRTRSVRSYVKQSRVQQGSTNRSPRPQPGRWHRPRAQKYMTVELEEPFVWPDRPKDMSPFNQRELRDSDRESKKMQEERGSTKDTLVNEDRRNAMAKQVKALLNGQEKWRPRQGMNLTSMLTR